MAQKRTIQIAQMKTGKLEILVNTGTVSLHEKMQADINRHLLYKYIHSFMLHCVGVGHENFV